MPRPFSPTSVFGVDFSGARLAGLNTWIARLDDPFSPRPRLTSLTNLAALANTPERTPALAALVSYIAASDAALWGLDFPFALPLELFPPGTTFPDQLRRVAAHQGDAPSWGRACVATSQRMLGRMHVRRLTDLETKTPFDCYHYRIVHQSFHGQRDVLLPLLSTPGTAILPMHPPTPPTQITRALVEACPASSLKRWNLPHQNYKQTASGPLTRTRLAVRKTLYTFLHQHLDIPDPLQRLISRNKGGDALDAVLAALATAQAYQAHDPAQIARHPRYPKEGLIFA